MSLADKLGNNKLDDNKFDDNKLDASAWFYFHRAKPLSVILSFYNSLKVEGLENIVRQGPNFIIGTHKAGMLDVTQLIRVYPKTLFFTANREWFDKEEAFKVLGRNVKNNLGKFLDFMLRPLEYAFVTYISGRVGKVGSVPIDIQGGDNSYAKAYIKKYIQKHNNGVFVFLQYQKKRKEAEAKKLILVKNLAHLAAGYLNRKNKEAEKASMKKPAPVIIVKKGSIEILYDIYNHGQGTDVPVTLVAMKTKLRKKPWFVRTNIIISKPYFISEYYNKENPVNTVTAFQQVLEQDLSKMYQNAEARDK